MEEHITLEKVEYVYSTVRNETIKCVWFKRSKGYLIRIYSDEFEGIYEAEVPNRPAAFVSRIYLEKWIEKFGFVERKKQ